jgi:hypothetical protein
MSGPKWQCLDGRTSGALGLGFGTIDSDRAGSRLSPTRSCSRALSEMVTRGGGGPVVGDFLGCGPEGDGDGRSWGCGDL